MRRLFVFLLLAGCGSLPEHLVLDASASDGGLAGTDGGLPDGANPATCKPPLVLVGVENLSGSGGGQVLALSLPSGEPCSSYTAGGQLPAQPLAVAWLPPSGIAAATRDGLYVMNADDSLRFHAPASSSQQLPIDVFPLSSGSTQFAVVGYENPTSSQAQIDELDAYSDGSGPSVTWSSSTAGISGIFPLIGATLSPLDPGHFFGLEPGGTVSNDAAVDVDPFGAAATDYRGYPISGSLISIAALVQGTVLRTVWVDAMSNGVLYINDTGGTRALSGPIQCAGATCKLIYAVPDPTEPHTFLALCESPGTTHRVLQRFSSTGGSCDLIFDGTRAGAHTRLSRLAVAP